MADPRNPYMPSGLDQLSTMLMALGSGIAGAAGSGRSGWEGIAPGVAMYSHALNNANQNAIQYDQWSKNYDLQESYRKAQEDALRAQTEQRQQELDITKKLMPGMQDLISGGVPGMSAPNTPTIGPGGGYFATTGSAESGNNYSAVNGKGSGAYGKYQFMPDTWASIAPSLGLPFNIRQSTPDQQEQAMRALTQRNAQSLGTNDPAALYLAHRFGADGAKTVLRADPSTPIASLFPPIWTQQNPDMQGVTVGQFRQNVQQRFGGNPQIVPQQGGGVVQPPRVDPMRFLPYTLSKTLAPFGQAGIAIGNSETDRYMKDQDRLQREQQFNRQQGGVEMNAKVGPNGQPNTTLIDAETEATRRKAEAEAAVTLDNKAAQQLASDAAARYEKEVRPPALAAAGGIENLYEMKRLVDSGVAAGPFMDSRQFAARTLDWLGITPMSNGQLNRTEFANRAGQNVLALLSSGALGRTQISEGDRKFAERMSASGGDFTDAELKRLMDIGIKYSQVTLKQHSDEVNRVRELPGMKKLPESYFKITAPSYDQWAKENPAPDATRPPLNSFGSGTRPPLSSFGGAR